MIVFSLVTKKFDARTVLDGLSFKIEPGEFVCITGPSGAGKSTIIHMLIRAEVPTGGTIEVDGVNLATLSPSILQMYRRRTGVVFQDYKLLADRTVYENVGFAMEVCGDDDKAIQDRVPSILSQVGLSQRMDAFPRELSGGEKARAALARALVHHPMIVVADEPTGNIDPVQSLEILALLQQLNAGGKTVILASHDQEIIDRLQSRVIRLENGKIVRDSLGGYNTTGKQPTTIHEARKHKIFDKPTSSTFASASSSEQGNMPSATSPSVEKNKSTQAEKAQTSSSGSEASRSIKPIAI